MKKFLEPEIDVIKLKALDVITTSDVVDEELENPDGGLGWG